MKAKRLLYDVSILWWKAGPQETDFADMDLFIRQLEALGKHVAFREDADDIIADLRTTFAETPFSTQSVIGASIDRLLSLGRHNWVRILDFQLNIVLSCVLYCARTRGTIYILVFRRAKTQAH